MEKSLFNQLGELFASSMAFRLAAATILAAGISLAMNPPPPSGLERVPIDTPLGTEIILDDVINRIGDIIPLE